jgi:hypothetical protein
MNKSRLLYVYRYSSLFFIKKIFWQGKPEFTRILLNTGWAVSRGCAGTGPVCAQGPYRPIIKSR